MSEKTRNFEIAVETISMVGQRSNGAGKQRDGRDHN